MDLATYVTSIRTGKKEDISDFDHDGVVGA